MLPPDSLCFSHNDSANHKFLIRCMYYHCPRSSFKRLSKHCMHDTFNLLWLFVLRWAKLDWQIKPHTKIFGKSYDNLTPLFPGLPPHFKKFCHLNHSDFDTIILTIISIFVRCRHYNYPQSSFKRLSKHCMHDTFNLVWLFVLRWAKLNWQIKPHTKLFWQKLRQSHTSISGPPASL